MSIILFNNINASDNYIIKEQEKCLSTSTDFTIKATALSETPILQSTPTTTTGTCVDCRVNGPNGAHRDDHSIDSGFASADEDEEVAVVEKLLELPEKHYTCLYCEDVREVLQSFSLEIPSPLSV